MKIIRQFLCTFLSTAHAWHESLAFIVIGFIINKNLLQFDTLFPISLSIASVMIGLLFAVFCSYLLDQLETKISGSFEKCLLIAMWKNNKALYNAFLVFLLYILVMIFYAIFVNQITLFLLSLLN